MADSTTTQATEGTTPQQTEGAGSKTQTFEPIKTQADFDEAFNKRWAREKAKYDNFETYKASHEELEQLKEANKSEVEKLRERAESAEAKVKDFETKAQIAAWKSEVAKATGIPEAALHGSTKEEIEAVAKELAPHFKKSTTPSASRQGEAPSDVDGKPDPLRELFNSR